MKEKKIKKGTTVRLHYACNFAGCDGYEMFTLEEDMTKEELDKIAYDVALEAVRPEGWFEIPEEGDEYE